MPDPLRSETSRPTEPSSWAEREAKIEQLLLTGLDHYFAAQYDQAINVWTRALFVDRNHARARAYIERARSAQAERQRESDALLSDGVDALRRGDSSEARRLLDAAMARGGASDELIALLDRVERLEQRIALPSIDETEDLPAPRLMLEQAPQSTQARVEWLALGALVLIIVAAITSAAGASRQEWGALVERALARRGAAAVPASVPPRDLALPVPRRAELTVTRARALMSSGKLRDALPLLESVRPTDPERAEADRLRGEIQHQLIAIGPLPATQTVASDSGRQP